MRRLTFLLPTLMLAVSATALAASKGHPAPTLQEHSAGGTFKKGKLKSVKPPVPSFSTADKNHDGFIEWSEAKPLGVPKAVFKKEDFHHNGKLTPTEWSLVQVEMIHTVSLPQRRSKNQAPIPQTVVKAIEAPNKATASTTATAPAKTPAHPKNHKGHGSSHT